jgi:acylphosphatase
MPSTQEIHNRHEENALLPHSLLVARQIWAGISRQRPFDPSYHLPPMIMAERLWVVVHGRVQAVGFRAFVYRQARSLGLRGWVRNRPDGTVECVAEGPRSDLEQLLTKLQEGPSAARVKRVESGFEDARGDLGIFDVRF